MNKQLFTNINSLELRYRLEQHLTQVFNDGTVSAYLHFNDCSSELQILSNSCNMPAYPELKLAYGIWLDMNDNDRYQVLYRFSLLYKDLAFCLQENHQTFLFCAIFIHEFTAIWIEMTEWPH